MLEYIINQGLTLRHLNLGVVINSRAMYRELEVLIHKLKQR